MHQIHIYSGKIYSDTGVGSVLRAIKEHFDLQKDLNSYVASLDVKKINKTIENQQLEKPTNRPHILRAKLRKLFYRKASQSSVITLLIFVKHFLNGFKVLPKLTLSSSVVVHDIWSLVAIRLLNMRVKSIYFVMHNNGSLMEAFRSSYPSIEGSMIYRYLDALTRNTINMVDGIIFLSDNSLKKFKAESLCHAAKLYVIPNGISKIGYSSNCANNNLINVHITGTVCDRKRQYLVVELCRRNMASSRFIFHVWGDGPDLERLKEMSIASSLDCIIFHGSTSSPFHNYNLGDIFFLPSKNEGLPIAVLESLRSGCINILTDTGANSELVEKSGGFLLKNSTDEEILKGAAQYFYDILSMSEEDRMHLAKKSIEVFNADYTVDAMMERYMKLS